MGTANRSSVGVDSLLGCDIVDLEGRRIGELHDYRSRHRVGRITHVFIAMNEPRYSDQRVMVPWSAFRVENDARRLRINTRADSSERGRPMPKGSAPSGRGRAAPPTTRRYRRGRASRLIEATNRISVALRAPRQARRGAGRSNRA